MLNPALKKALSAVLVAVLGALLVAIQQKLVPLAPEAVQATLIAAIAGLAHYLDAWGHQDRVAVAVAKATRSVPPPAKPPSIPPLAAACLGLLCIFALGGCAFFESKLPDAEKCLPTTASLAAQVADILAAGGDTTTALEQLAVTQPEQAVICAVKAFLSKPAASPNSSPARFRARAYLATKGAK